MNAYILTVLRKSKEPLSINEIKDAIFNEYYKIVEYDEVYRCLHKYIGGVYDKLPCGKRRYVYGIK